MDIREDNLTGKVITRFLREHLDNMHDITPPGGVHAMDVEALRAPEVTFWSAWEGEVLLGCGALKELDPRRGEIKSMRTVVTHRGKGVASALLEHMTAEAVRRGYRELYLETGAQPEFAPARALYERHGFTYRGPFGDYTDDPNSVFMMKRIGDAGSG